ncbi:2-C-methyl-D-erythritol 2,4-cyclodiphosphate synthase [Candidatus Profftia lariciata]|uniref:2-C-methyl-D-erythritol 2,4-cyclodiphosphate synthase n=1 Tax=Candidatus Profftia lariciata TaxID=1987921 RepID=UPI001D01E94F|nr:2-C-methyl-D-erythritol 2,4-cyclodiphosphate synthase [Candidatus Profftia lariciata]UDG81493.1 2-C-methyl-D-erythritol 2,4-cyclodiphosphate synthase [Candidatus Profftia lariciata]
MRIGHGFDVHRFGGSSPLIIGGVSIPYKYGFIAHSDGDVLLHAATDALLGAASLGDIGILFPNSEPAFKDIASCKLLQEAFNRIQVQGYYLGNLDITVIAQDPHITPYISQMRVNLAKHLNCSIDHINIKSTTTENLGFIGRGEGIACEAVALLLHKAT